MTDAFDRLGYGTYKLAAGEECAAGVAHAIETGYRHVDTAQGYDNEASVGDGIDRSDVDREELFVATKLSTDNLSYDDAVETARASRDRLGVDSIDLLYVHWPIDSYDPEETLPALDDLVDDGVIDRIGLSNFEPDQLDEAIDRLDREVFAHQVECHPLLQQERLREYAVEDGHWLVAYSPIARNRVADVDVHEAGEGDGEHVAEHLEDLVGHPRNRGGIVATAADRRADRVPAEVGPGHHLQPLLLADHRGHLLVELGGDVLRER